MSIIYIPPEVQINNLACSICHVELSLDKATAGLFDATNRQAFACVSHLSEVELLIVGWAEFMADEREKYLHQKREAETLGMGHDAWFNS